VYGSLSALSFSLSLSLPELNTRMRVELRLASDWRPPSFIFHETAFSKRTLFRSPPVSIMASRVISTHNTHKHKCTHRGYISQAARATFLLSPSLPLSFSSFLPSPPPPSFSPSLLPLCLSSFFLLLLSLSLSPSLSPSSLPLSPGFRFRLLGG
jgi:hypothetical protein